MKFLPALSFLILCALPACDKPSRPDVNLQSTSMGTPIHIGTTFMVESKAMRSPREINIWTPPGYKDSGKTYPVLYVLDGGIAQDFHHISGLAQLTAINGIYENLIVVGIKTENRLGELAHTAADPRYIQPEPRAGNSHVFTKFVQDEVIPFVEKNYRTGERRAVIGESLAGLFVTEVFLKRPGMFTDYIAISPSLWWDDKNLAKDAPTLLAAHDDNTRRLYLTMGDEGGTMQGGFDLVMAAISSASLPNLKWTYVDRRREETHSSIYHGAAMDALKFSFGLPKVDYGPDPWYLVEGGQPEDDEK